MANSILEAVNKTESVEDIEALSGLLEMTYSSPDATRVAPPNSENIIASNMAAQAAQIATIGPTPWYETEEGAETLMNIAIGSAGGGIGASIRGGKSAKSIKQLLEDINIRYGMKRIPGKPGAVYGRFNGQRLENSSRLIEVAEKKLISWNNKISSARIKNQKALKKHGIADPDAEEVISPVNYLLDAMRKIKRN